MITYPNTTQQITRKATTTTETFDGDGNLVSREIFEEIEYAPQPATLPNQPWILTNATNAVHVNHVNDKIGEGTIDYQGW
jgi:hypothetical protein